MSLYATLGVFKQGDDMSSDNFPAIVAKVRNEDTVVINKGLSDGIKLGQRFLIYFVEDKETLDPITNESLGKLEIVRGTGKVSHIQERLATVSSDRFEVIKKKPLTAGFAYFSSYQSEERIELPFDDPKVGDLAKPI